LSAAFADGVRAKDAEGIAVVTAYYGFDFFGCHEGLFVMKLGRRWGPCNTVALVGRGGFGRRDRLHRLQFGFRFELLLKTKDQIGFAS
jgi:hypothetical protein